MSAADGAERAHAPRDPDRIRAAPSAAAASVPASPSAAAASVPASPSAAAASVPAFPSAASPPAAPERRGFLDRFAFSRRCPGRPAPMILWFDLCEAFCRLSLKLCYRFRITGEALVPKEGPCLFVSNHQSLLDPVLNGCAVVDRQLTAMAREGLFRSRAFSWLMRSFGAISLKEEGGDTAAFKAALGELREGRSILIYPEGSRTEDGEIHDFQPGVALLIRRAKVAVVPIGIEGAFEVWPRGRRLPRLCGRIEVEVGRPLAPEELPREPEALLALLRERVRALVDRRRAAMIRSGWRPARLAHLFPRRGLRAERRAAP